MTCFNCGTEMSPLREQIFQCDMCQSLASENGDANNGSRGITTLNLGVVLIPNGILILCGKEKPL